MKLYIFITAFLCLCFNIQAQNTEHLTIDKLEVSYKEPDIMAMDTIKMVRSQSIITLKSDTNVAVIHFKIIKETDNSVMYQVDYLMNSATITNTEGIIVFKKEGNIIYINSSSQIPLNMYLYQITTEDAQGNISEPFIELH